MASVIDLEVRELKLKKKLIIYYLSSTFLVLFFVGLAALNAIKALSINTIEQQLMDQSSLAELYISQIHALQNKGSDELSDETAQYVIGKLGLVFGNIRIYDNNLRLQATSKENTEISITDSENEELLNAAAKGNYAYLVRDSMAYFTSPITFEGNTIGILEFIYPMSFLESLIFDVANILLISAIIFVVLMILISIYIASRLTKPINKLAAAANNYANRVFTPVEIKGSDEISQLSQSFNAMGEQLHDYIQRQKQFVSNVSHELRTPLTAIKGYSEFLADEIGDRPDLKKAIFHLKKESDRLAKLVDEVLTLSRLETDREVFHFNRLNLSTLIMDTIEKMLLRAQKYEIKIITNVVPEVYVRGDKEKLVQVFVNLLDNAFKFSPPLSTVRVSLYKETAEAILMIVDQGIGIPEKDRSKVFQRFYRAENAHSTSGTGLGLSIVKHIMDAHSGSIKLAEGTEGGTTVILRLPIED
ncbi:MAG: HAMP domain-containing histidine kinase [Clostridiales bacterium]|nr:HAMP domain-containing histidine kinase [Clostridiales bacterium]